MHSGRHIYYGFLSKKYMVYVVNSDGNKFDINQWHLSRTFNYAEQDKFIISDKHTRKYLNLKNQKIIYGNKSVKFNLDPAKKKRLLEGLDDIGTTLKTVSNIDNYENKLKVNKPWIARND